MRRPETAGDVHVPPQDSQVLPQTSPTSTDTDALELAVLERLVREVPVPSADLPGWQSLTAGEYAAAVHELSDLLGTVASALAAARAAG